MGDTNMKKTVLTLAKVKEIDKALETAPELNEEERAVTKQEAIGYLVDKITMLTSEKGYTLEKVASLLTSSGLPITVQTLKNYLNVHKKSKKSIPAKPIKKLKNTNQDKNDSFATDKATFEMRSDTNDI